MDEIADSRKVCRACGSPNELAAERCAVCGADLDAGPESSADGFVDEDPRLLHVDPENRIEVERYERWDEAELACGFLRANDIPCELSSMVLPGLPADLILWVHKQDAELAWALLADAEREAANRGDEVA
jgi:hypothetical protein